MAEAYDAGACGLEECDGSAPSGRMLLVYASAIAADAVLRAVRGVPGVRAGVPEACPSVDWTERWREGLVPIVVSPELVVRPSCVATTLAPGQRELEIDPGRAFGTGGHESTRLALEVLASLPRAVRAGASVLDVGTGSGVLALAAIRLGATSAIGVDCDPTSPEVARENALRNGLDHAARFVTGSLAALRTVPFDLVLANLLRSELLPMLPALSRHFGPATHGVLAGLLDADVPEVLTALEAVALHGSRSRERVDADGTVWAGLLVRRIEPSRDTG